MMVFCFFKDDFQQNEFYTYCLICLDVAQCSMAKWCHSCRSSPILYKNTQQFWTESYWYPKVRNSKTLCCFQVRETAGTAFAKAALAFPEELKPRLPEIWPLWLALLDDNVWSVRQHAAVNIADLVRAYGHEISDNVLLLLRWAVPWSLRTENCKWASLKSCTKEQLVLIITWIMLTWRGIETKLSLLFFCTFLHDLFQELIQRSNSLYNTFCVHALCPKS